MTNLNITVQNVLERKFQKLLYDLYLVLIMYVPLMKVSTYG